MPLIDDILRHPDVVEQPGRSGEAKAWCPWHPDKAGGKPSLGINKNKRTVKCWVCGEPKTKPLNSLAEAWDIKPKSQRPPADPIEATYDYKDENGLLLYQAVRIRDAKRGKSFRQRRPDQNRAGEWHRGCHHRPSATGRLPWPWA